MIFVGKSSAASRICRVALILFVPMALLACGGKDAAKAATQTAAKVNRSEITVHQVNFYLQQQRIAPDQLGAASKEVLERLINQELTLQKATDLKLERDAKVMQQIDFARRDIIARAYIDRITNSVSEPTSDDIHQYFEKNPALFKERKVYGFQELNILSDRTGSEELRAALAASKNINAFIEQLKAKGIKFSSSSVTRAAEQLPISNLEAYAKLKEGQTVINQTPSGLQVLVLQSVQSQPIDEAHAKSAIEQFILNERKRKVIENDLQQLRESAKIEYVGEYAKHKMADGSDLKSDSKSDQK